MWYPWENKPVNRGTVYIELIHLVYRLTVLIYTVSLSILTAIFQVNLGYLMFIEAKDDGGGVDNWTTLAISRAKLQSNHHHQQTNIQFFTGRMPVLSPNQQCQSTEGKNITFDLHCVCANYLWFREYTFTLQTLVQFWLSPIFVSRW